MDLGAGALRLLGLASVLGGVGVYGRDLHAGVSVADVDCTHDLIGAQRLCQFLQRVGGESAGENLLLIQFFCLDFLDWMQTLSPFWGLALHGLALLGFFSFHGKRSDERRI